MTKKKLTQGLLGIILICLLGFGTYHLFSTNLNKKLTETTKQVAVKTDTSTTEITGKTDAATDITTSSTVADETTPSSSTKNEEPVDWQGPSENIPYPTLQTGDWVDVSIAQQRAYIKRGTTTLYTMLCNTGKDNATPIGEFVIEPERGDTFFNQNSGEGANYWVSFKNHGTYLFHSVPIDENGEYIVSEAEELGKEPISHGCIRLSIADAQWFYENAIEGMKVVIS